MLVLRFKTVDEIPQALRELLKKECLVTKLGFMRERLDVNTHHFSYPTVMMDGKKVAAWAIVGVKNKANAWTNRQYRRRGLAPKVLAFMMDGMPRLRAKALHMKAQEAESLLVIAKYLQVNQLHRVGI